MELFATGFNAWNQLEFRQNAASKDEPHDYFEFAKVLHGHVIERPLATLCYTLARVDGRIVRAGASDVNNYKFASEYGVVETAGGLAFTTNASSILESTDEGGMPKQGFWQYSRTTTESGQYSVEFFPSHSPVRQIAAFDVGAIILHEDGSVATLGDPRFEDCLGREPTDESPANKPGRVVDLEDLDDPVKRVAAGGYTVGALTEAGSLYIWGTKTVGTHRREQAFATLSSVPNYVEVDGGKDVKDVAIGESHALALTTDGCIYVIGNNQNGQLGLGKNGREKTKDWVKVSFAVPNDHQVVGVAAGPRCSFIITSSIQSTAEATNS
ncbi:E3 ISG15--protein ligase Herc6 [Paramyrothecium foliicola]|nr:E3 ISG15--protein ligase Herc6 [Paramyrothecium foliicola]